MTLMLAMFLTLAGVVHCATWIWAVTVAKTRYRLIVAALPAVWVFCPEWLTESSPAMRGIGIGSILLAVLCVVLLASGGS